MAFGRRAGSAACQSPPTVDTRTPWRQTYSTATSRAPSPTRCGWLGLQATPEAVHQLHPHQGGLALPRCGEGPRHDGDHRVVDVGPSQEHPVRRCPEDGYAEPAAAEGPDPPLRPRGSVCLHWLPQAARGKWHPGVDEQKGELPGQRPDGELLRY